MIYGNPLYHRSHDVTDRVGIRTLTLSKMWQPSRPNLSEAEIDAEEPFAPAVSGGLELIGRQCQPYGGCYRTSWTFEGVNGTGKDVTFKDRQHTRDFGMDSGMSQVSIKLFKGNAGSSYKSFQELLDVFQGYLDPESDQVFWPASLSKTNWNSGLTKGAGSGDTNPMFGIQEFFRMEGSYWCRYCSVGVPRNLFRGVGAVTTDLPGEPPTDIEGRNWLKIAPLWRNRGFITEILERFWLSGPGGWPVPVYGGGGRL